MKNRACQAFAAMLAAAVGFALVGARPGAAQPAPHAGHDAAWDSVGRILQSPPVARGGYVRFDFPRRDVTLRVRDVVVSPSLALGAWAGFQGAPDNATMMGDLVLTSAELEPVLATLARQGLAVTAIHNHLAGESPHIAYVHFHGEGDARQLASRLDTVLRRTAAPRPVTPSSPRPATFDTAMVFRAMGASGRSNGNVAQLSFILVPGGVTMHGESVDPALAYGSPVNIQFVDSSRAVATGDFAVLERGVDPVLDALAANGITATAVHSHLVGEEPRIYYIHFWADGRAADVLRGLRAAVDAGRATP